MTELTLHDVEPVCIGEDPQPHYALDPWAQPRAGENDQLIDTRDGHGESQTRTGGRTQGIDRRRHAEWRDRADPERTRFIRGGMATAARRSDYP